MNYILKQDECIKLGDTLQKIIQEECQKEEVSIEYTRTIYADVDTGKQIKVPDIDLFEDIWQTICEKFADLTNTRVWIDFVKYIRFAYEEKCHFKV